MMAGIGVLLGLIFIVIVWRLLQFWSPSNGLQTLFVALAHSVSVILYLMLLNDLPLGSFVILSMVMAGTLAVFQLSLDNGFFGVEFRREGSLIFSVIAGILAYYWLWVTFA